MPIRVKAYHQTQYQHSQSQANQYFKVSRQFENILVQKIRILEENRRCSLVGNKPVPVVPPPLAKFKYLQNFTLYHHNC